MTTTAGYEAYEGAGELLRALSAPIRVAIVTELAGGERCVHELVDKLGAPQPLVSQHLRVLRGAGVVRGARRGREIAYTLVDEHIAHIVADAVSHAREAHVRERGPEAGSTRSWPRSEQPGLSRQPGPKRAERASQRGPTAPAHDDGERAIEEKH